MSELISTLGTIANQKEFIPHDFEPDWLQKMRLKAWTKFLELPWESDPNMLNFVNKKLLKSLKIHFPPKMEQKNPKQISLHPEIEKINVYFSPNETGLSFPLDLPKNIQNSVVTKSLNINTLNNPEFAEKVKKLLNIIINDKLATLAKSSFEWGSYLQISNKTAIEHPIQIRYGSTSNTTHPLTGFHIIDISDNVEVTLDVQYSSAEFKYVLSNTFLRVGKNSHVNILLNDSGRQDRNTVRTMITHIGKDASVNFTQLQTKGEYIRQRSEFHFTGEGGNLTEIACIRGRNKQIFDFYSAVIHDQPNVKSNTIARGVMDNEALAWFKGLIDITKNAPQTNTALNLSGLLLSKKARFHTIPALEVSNSNVIASHGASVSKIDPELIFYLQTRGIPTNDAEHIISNGYFTPAIEKIRNKYLREKSSKIMRIAVDEQFPN